MAKTLKVGFVGTGGIAQAHLAAWDKIADTEVVALCDINPQALTSSAEKWGVPSEPWPWSTAWSCPCRRRQRSPWRQS